VLGEINFSIPATQARAAREVTQTLRVTPVVLKAPQGKGKSTPAVHLTAVLAREEAPPKGVEAVEWLLLTTCTVDTFEQACETMSWYLARWSIEIYQPYNLHKCHFSIMRQWWQATACARQWLALRGAVSAQPRRPQLATADARVG
jgi:hypothetical protein